jgi:hypothetical protein
MMQHETRLKKFALNVRSIRAQLGIAPRDCELLGVGAGIRCVG